MKQFGVENDDFRDFWPLIASWITKLIALVTLTTDNKSWLMQFGSFYTILTCYATAELYITLSFVLYIKIGRFREHLK
jgi:hypothetical protein